MFFFHLHEGFAKTGNFWIWKSDKTDDAFSSNTYAFIILEGNFSKHMMKKIFPENIDFTEIRVKRHALVHDMVLFVYLNTESAALSIETILTTS